MSREWKPGDVAMVTDVTGVVRPMVRIGHDPAERCWHGAESNGDLRCLADGQEQDARPLVVIDPDDREQVARLVNLYEDHRPGNTRLLDHMTAALREFANPTPPKPAEPTGLGAVVEDAKGNRWVRFCETSSPAWCSEPYDDEDYADIDAVRVLSEGIS